MVEPQDPTRGDRGGVPPVPPLPPVPPVVGAVPGYAGQLPAAAPYWGPQASFTPVDPTDCVGRRVGAALIDSVILLGPQLGILFALMWGPISAMVRDAERRPGRTATSADLDLTGSFMTRYFLALLAMWLMQFLYFFVTERAWRGSPGKLALGLRVVRANGYAPISWGQSAGRNSLRVLFDNGIVALILCLVTKGHRRVGDMAAHTLVIRKEWVGRFAELWPPNGFPPWEPNPGGAQMVLPPQPGYG